MIGINFMNKLKNLSDNNIIFLTIILSLLCSYLSLHNVLVNNDGILYIKTSEVFLSHGFKSALQTYHWPLYSILVAYISKITSLDVLTSYYFVNAVLQALIILLYLKIFLTLSPTRRQLGIAALSIMMFPQFNEYRHEIIKDFGYWLCCLMGLLSLIRFYLEDNKSIINKHVIYYHLSFFIGFLFRAEALILSVALPLSIFCFDLPRESRKSFIKEKLLTIYFPLLFLIFTCIIIALTTVLFFSHKMSWNELAFSLYFNLHIYQLDTLINVYTNSITALNQYIFTQTPINSFAGSIFLIFGATAVFIIKFINVFNIINITLLFYFLYLLKKIGIKNCTASIVNNNDTTHTTTSNTVKILLFAAIITSMLPLIFLYLIFVTAGRYYVLSSIILLLFVPFSIDYLWQKFSSSISYHNYKYWFNSAISLLIMIITVSGLTSFGYSKDYIRQAGLWYKNQNYDLTTTYTNNSQLSFYSGVKNALIEDSFYFDGHISQSKNHGKVSNFRYLLLKIKHSDNTLINKINELSKNNDVEILNNFANKRGDRVIILKNSGNNAELSG